MDTSRQDAAVHAALQELMAECHEIMLPRGLLRRYLYKVYLQGYRAGEDSANARRRHRKHLQRHALLTPEEKDATEEMVTTYFNSL
jgi:hypothetical protein